MTVPESNAYNTAETVARRSYGRLVAFLAVRTRDVAAAEDALSEAFAAALADWPRNGCPANPEAWLLTVARRKIIDTFRSQLRHEVDDEGLSVIAEVPDAEEIPDRRLALMFVCAHPSIDPAIRAPLILQAVLGLDAARIASAFLTSPAAMGKRLVRAKDKIRHAGIPFKVPEREELPGRLETVLDAIYAAFTEGWIDPAGAAAARRDLKDEALFLARLVNELLPNESETLGLLALMLYAEARRPARRNAQGEYVPLAEQDRSRWDRAAVSEGTDLITHALATAPIGPYQLEAAIAAVHDEAARAAATDWRQILALYRVLESVKPSPVVRLNLAVAAAMVHGPQTGLDLLASLDTDERMAGYHRVAAVRGHLLDMAGQHDAARASYLLAARRTTSLPEQRYLESRAARCRAGRAPSRPGDNC